ncbi:MAG: PH domain-containing protein [Bryobacteraceae bacterium]
MPEATIRPSLKLVKAGYVAVLLVIGAAFYCWNLTPQENWWPPALTALLLLWPASKHLVRRTTTITMQGDKLRYETGILSKTTRTIQLSKVQDVRVDRSLMQRILGLGNLTIETAGESSRLTIENIDDPQTGADMIMEKAGKGSDRSV